MTPEQRTRRMVGFLPPVLQSGARIRRVFAALGAELGGPMETGLTRLMRSRWYLLAHGFEADASLEDKAGSELGRLAAPFGLQPRRGEPADYFRHRLATLVRLHRTGLTSARALLELVALVYMARPPLAITWEGELAVGTLTVPQADGSWRTVRVELEDTPATPAEARFRGVGPGQRMLTLNQGLEPAIPELSLRARDEQQELSIPVLHHLESGLDVLFLGRVPAGRVLTLRQGRAPLIDGTPVDTPVVLSRPTRFSARGDPPPLARFDDPDTRFSVFNERRALPELRPGDNHWTYSTLERSRVRASLLGWAPETLARAEQQALEQKHMPPVDLTVRWTERTPATFVLRAPVDLLPAHLRQPDPEGLEPGLPGLVRELFAALAYGRAAGVRARIEFTFALPSESLTLTEGPTQQDVELTFTGDSVQAREALASLGSALQLQEQVPEPRDALSWDAVFDVTRLDTSRFPR